MKLALKTMLYLVLLNGIDKIISSSNIQDNSIMEKIRVLVVDDTAFMRKAVTQLLETDPDIEVAGSASNGLEALKMIRKLKPDVITLDIDMPVMDGLTAIRHIMICCPVPIVALSSLSAQGSVTFEALRLGVVDFVPKPSGAVSPDISSSAKQIINRVKIACSMTMGNVRRVRLPKKWSTDMRLANLYRYYPLEYAVVLGTTLGGPNTVIRLLSRLSPTVPAAVLVIQEISPTIIHSFAARFNEYVPWKVEVAQTGMLMEQGTCYICSNEFSMSIMTNENEEPFLTVNKGIKKTAGLIIFFCFPGIWSKYHWCFAHRNR
ncbi:response regulator [Desulfonema limicola]|nr:response regulator [Desulfonema limicola]